MHLTDVWVIDKLPIDVSHYFFEATLKLLAVQIKSKLPEAPMDKNPEVRSKLSTLIVQPKS